MYTLEALNEVVGGTQFHEDYAHVHQWLVADRAGQPSLFASEQVRRLRYFIDSVLASAPTWEETREARRVCQTAAEAAESLSHATLLADSTRSRLRLRATLLYELAGMPAVAATVLNSSDVPSALADMFRRRGVFERLGAPLPAAASAASRENAEALNALDTLADDAIALAEWQQGERDALPENTAAASLSEVAQWLAVGLTATDLRAFDAVVRRRVGLATRAVLGDQTSAPSSGSSVQQPYTKAEQAVPDVGFRRDRADPNESSSTTPGGAEDGGAPVRADTRSAEGLLDALRIVGFPAELWEVQREAIREGLLDARYDSWGLGSPTGTGKTFLTRLLILHTLRLQAGAQVLYVVPSRALVHEVTTKLSAALGPIGISVNAVSPQLVALGSEEHDVAASSDVLVLTPEKADMLARLGPALFEKTVLIIVDEAHHLEAGTRGVLLELYLWRIRRLARPDARVVCLSAVAPNIHELVEWLGRRPHSVNRDERATRMRVGSYKLIGRGRARVGVIEYTDGSSVQVVAAGASSAARAGIVELAMGVVSAGPVLVVAKGRGECEALARLTYERLKSTDRLSRLTDEQMASELVQRLDARLEREMYAQVPLRNLIANRVAYHHAGLPPRVRVAVEEAIRQRLVDYVYSTTTLAEGVNFPFATVVVQSLALRTAPALGRPSRYQPVTPRTFWNIAGRAGRPGADAEGQVVLYTPTLGLDRVGKLLTDYLTDGLKPTEPVRSALATSLQELGERMARGEVTEETISELRLSDRLSPELVGTLNLVRVGLVHGRAANLVSTPDDLLEGTFAATLLQGDARRRASRIVASQSRAVESFLDSPGAPSVELVAQLGLSLETLSEIHEHVHRLDDEALAAMSEVTRGGVINRRNVERVVSPLASRMAELEGPKLGGFLSELILDWMDGIPFARIRTGAARTRLRRLEDLISMIYSRVQYLLPWGLYAFDRVVSEEARRRSVPYDGQIQTLAYLADAGVPDVAALRLVALEFERVDATRLAREYRRLNLQRSQNIGIIAWIANERRDEIVRVLRGADRRRLDFDLDRLIEVAKAESEQSTLLA